MKTLPSESDRAGWFGVTRALKPARAVAACVFVASAAAPCAQGGYVMHVTGGAGQSEVLVLPGQSVSVQVRLDRDDSSKHDSAVFRLEFSRSGLEFAPGWYEWASPYETGGQDDFSSPGVGASGVIDEATHDGAFFPGSLDVYFENLTPNAGDVFNEGVLLSATFRVPKDATEEDEFVVSATPDTFTDGASFVPAQAGGGLRVRVVPAPGGVGLAVLGAALAGWRGRRR